MMQVLERRHLLHDMQRALAAGPLFIEAPAGFGKTVLLGQLAARRPQSYYLSLTAADSDIAVLKERLMPLLSAEHTLLLDDVHHLPPDSESIAWLDEQLQQGGPQWVLAGRWIPSPTLGEARRLTEESLAFTLNESLAQLRPVTATEQQLAAWHDQLEGWPMGVNLLSRQTAYQPLPTVQQELFPLLAQQVIETLPVALRRFLQLSAVPLRFSDAMMAVLLAEHDPPLATEAAALRAEVEQRNLFLREEEGWYRYHDLFRAYLLHDGDVDVAPVASTCVAYLEAQDNLPDAIEQALASGLHEDAARLLMHHPRPWVYDRGRYQTFARWVDTLDQATQRAHPMLVILKAMYLANVMTRTADAMAALEQGEAWAAELGDDESLDQAVLVSATFNIFLQGNRQRVIERLRHLLDRETLKPYQQIYGIRILASLLRHDGRLRETARLYRQASVLTTSHNFSVNDRRRDRIDEAWLTKIPLGDFASAETTLRAALADEGLDRSNTVSVMAALGWLAAERGDPARLRAAVASGQHLIEAQEHKTEMLYAELYRLDAIHALLVGNLDRAATALEIGNSAVEEPETSLELAAVESWMHRRRGDAAAARQVAQTALDRWDSIVGSCAIVALELEIGNTLAGTGGSDELHPALSWLVQERAKAWLVRLRVMLAVRCGQAGDGRWRRHAHSALRTCERTPLYDRLLTTRDPDLNARFWAMLLAEQVEVAQAQAALATIGLIGPVLPLLAHKSAAVRAAAASTLAAIGDEGAMPALADALGGERDRNATAAMKAALSDLERATPPPLRVQLMGDFALWRGDERLPDSMWPRPIVRRLFQYFALHPGEALPRDRILEEFWGEEDAKKAAASFRTVYSALGQVLDPHLRPRATPRYFAVTGDSYRFDPHGVVESDAQQFKRIVGTLVKQAPVADLRPLPDEFVAQLNQWQPLLPPPSYAAWLGSAQDAHNALYVEGCHYAGRALLERGHAAEAALWGEKIVEAAPWFEAGYQLLMRAYARQGQRSRALKLYEQAVAALDAELGVAPAKETQWLAQRLREDQTL